MAYTERKVVNYLYAHHKVSVYYSAKPIYKDKELVPRSVIVDVKSSDGKINERIIVYNAAKGFKINYKKGTFKSVKKPADEDPAEPDDPDDPDPGNTDPTDPSVDPAIDPDQKTVPSVQPSGNGVNSQNGVDDPAYRQQVFDSLSDEQKDAVYSLIGYILEDEQNQKGGNS
jgi:hypothetical protein